MGSGLRLSGRNVVTPLVGRSRLRAVTFDAAGTLFGLRDPVGAVYAAAALAHGLPPREGLAELLEQRFREAFRALRPPEYRPGDRAHNDAEDRAWWRRLVVRVMGGLEPFALDAFFDEIWQTFAEPSVWQKYPDVDAVLQVLRGAGLRLAIVSNFDARLVPVCRGLELEPRVDTIVFAAQTGAAKPDPGIFREAVSRLGVIPGETLHVGDSFAEDVAGARAAGLHAVHLQRDAPKARPQAGTDASAIRDLRGLAALIPA
ncbi:Phosphoglycolate phosphatase, prokaryotic: HAD-superfamily hydrolase [Thioalkalivibrio nitratireducens DSM 14787]|uniref:Phosphoglycolate phosphatase, prokaryotic: HAD-superfamily hydrolase n=1 Tax=Thioalkalivibrio nitratireducens (strain DSM 14787 / UNIQEM 213 / ALEN2) TaxID=1255043 RepID=L0DU37_THIND|nr:HAD-IA family hydrolase [Thioalkalivibrio nitratireducens]AGA33109.1 Phosphoglycolate phosphatase, prokaryotic: HAD-superfamily hydrolase [Thioalkalivibrio nitratireducens DSM 14787]